MTNLSDEALNSAQRLIDALTDYNAHDYSTKVQEIAQHYDDYLFNGDWNSYLDLDDMPGIRFIQEDEYDQHMEDKPDYDFFCGGHYIAVDRG